MSVRVFSRGDCRNDWLRYTRIDDKCVEDASKSVSFLSSRNQPAGCMQRRLTSRRQIPKNVPRRSRSTRALLRMRICKPHKSTKYFHFRGDFVYCTLRNASIPEGNRARGDRGLIKTRCEYIRPRRLVYYSYTISFTFMIQPPSDCILNHRFRRIYSIITFLNVLCCKVHVECRL